MSCLSFFAGHSWMHRLDPRTRLLAAAGLTGAITLCERPIVMGWALLLAVVLAASARLNMRALTRRLLHLNAFMLILWFVLPWSIPGTLWGKVHGVGVTREGVRLAMAITLKGNAIVLFFTALVATINPPRLACALKRLGLPDKLVLLFALTIRYTDVLHDEYARLRQALRARAFHPRFSFHTLRTFGYLVGLLVVRAMERAERVLAAMKCRAFDGRFHALEECAMRRLDRGVVLAALAQAAAWIWMGRA